MSAKPVKLHEWQQNNRPSRSATTAKEPTDAWVQPQSCHVCGKVIPGAYGFTTLEKVVWSCSATCEKEVAKLRSLYYRSNHDPVQRASGEEADGTTD